MNFQHFMIRADDFKIQPYRAFINLCYNKPKFNKEESFLAHGLQKKEYLNGNAKYTKSKNIYGNMTILRTLLVILMASSTLTSKYFTRFWNLGEAAIMLHA